MDKTIKTICDALQEEAEAVKSYTDRMDDASSADVYRTFAINRLDALEHIQNLVLVLTRLLSQGDSEETEGDDYV